MYQGRDTTGRTEGLVTVFTKLGVRCSGTRRKDFPREAYGLVRFVGQSLFSLLFLNSGLVSFYFTIFFFFSFFLSQEQGIMPECEICGDQGC